MRRASILSLVFFRSVKNRTSKNLLGSQSTMFNKALSFRDAGGSIHIEVLDDGGVYTGEKTKEKSKPEGDYLFSQICETAGKRLYWGTGCSWLYSDFLKVLSNSSFVIFGFTRSVSRNN